MVTDESKIQKSTATAVAFIVLILVSYKKMIAKSIQNSTAPAVIFEYEFGYHIEMIISKIKYWNFDRWRGRKSTFEFWYYIKMALPNGARLNFIAAVAACPLCFIE